MQKLFSNILSFKTFIISAFAVMIVLLFNVGTVHAKSSESDLQFVKIDSHNHAGNASEFSLDSFVDNDDDDCSENHTPEFHFENSIQQNFSFHKAYTTHISSGISISEVVWPMQHKCSTLSKFLI